MQGPSFVSAPESGSGIRPFKEGLGTSEKATERRRDENISLRKAKREHKFKQRRAVHSHYTDKFEAKIDTVKLMQQYQPQALLAYDVKQVHLLNEILHHMDEDSVEKYYENLFDIRQANGGGGHVFRILLEAMQKPNLSLTAAKCLANATGKLANENYMARVCTLLLQHNVIKAVFNTLLQVNAPEELRTSLWTLVFNVCYPQGAKGAELLYTSPLMPLILEEIRVDSNLVAYSLVDLMRLLIEHVQLPIEWQRIFYLELCKRATGPLEQSGGQELDSDDFEMSMSALVGLWLIYKQAEEELHRWFLLQDQHTWQMMRIFNKYLFQIQHKDFRYRIMALYNVMSSLPTDDHVLQKKILQHECLPIFIRACQSNESEMRKEALFCIGSFMAEGTQFVLIALRPPFNIMEPILSALRDRNHKIKIGALYCSMTMFQVANEERMHNMQTRVECDTLLRTLIVQHKILHLVLPFLQNVASIEQALVLDILRLVLAALVWNKPLVLEALSFANGLDAFNALGNAVHKLKTQQNTQIFDLAMQIDEMIDAAGGGGGEHEIMELDVGASGMYQF